MRAIVVCFALCVLFAVGTVVVAIRESRPHTGSWFPDPHAPETADERAAARVVERFAAAVAHRDKPTACRLASGEQARALRCGSDDEPAWPACEAKPVIEAIEAAKGVEVTVPGCRVRVAHLSGGWRVLEDMGLVGYA